VKSLTQADCDRMRRLCEIHPQVVVAQLMHIDKDTVWRIKKRGFTATRGGPARRPMPDDFRIQADALSLHELARHYRTGLCCINRWVKEAGSRDFTPRSSAHITPQRIRPEREVVEAAVAEHGPTKAAHVLGVHPTTLQKWREFYGLPIYHKRVILLRKRVPDKRWAETYHLRHAA
jgi:transposase-like protein